MVICIGVFCLGEYGLGSAAAESADLDAALSALLGEGAHSISELGTAHPALKDEMEALVPEEELWQHEDTTIQTLWTHPLLYQLSTNDANCGENRHRDCMKNTYILDEGGVQELFSLEYACAISTEVLSCVQDGETITITVGYVDEEAWDWDLYAHYTAEYTIVHCFEKENGEWQEVSLLPTLLAEAAQSESISLDMQPSMARALELLLSKDEMWGWLGEKSVVIHHSNPPMYLVSALGSASCQEPLFMLDEDGLQYLMGIGSDCGPLSHEILSCEQDGDTKITITILSTYYEEWDSDLYVYGMEEEVRTNCFEKEDGEWQEAESRTLSWVFYPDSVSQIPAELNQSMATRTGPGTGYTEDLGTLPKDTEIIVLQQEMGGSVPWGLVEFELDGMYYRAYTGMKRIDADSEPPWAEKPQTARVIESVTPRYGPGSSAYAPFGHTLEAGAQVEVFGRDWEYALIDYPSPDEPGKRTRSWIPLAALEGYEPPAIVRTPADDEA